ncbi:acyl-coenzyme A thioesterase 9 [Pelomyxa schiedti]|nr:acyl-coenzyme A thioesterase 9 [Pelomyxa schiedti]
MASPAPMPPRRPRETVVRRTLPYASDPAFRSKNVSALGVMRVGKLLEHLDALAALVAHRYAAWPAPAPPPPAAVPVSPATATTADSASDSAAASPPPSRPASPVSALEAASVATAAVDRIIVPMDFTRVTRDVVLEGRVTWVGRTSMEVMIDARLSGYGELGEGGAAIVGSSPSSSSPSQPRLVAMFVFVAKDIVTRKPVAISPLVPETAEEIRWNEDAAKRQQQRRKRVEESLTNKPPTAEEWESIHSFFVEANQPAKLHPPRPSITIAKTEFNNLVYMHPQKRNANQTIFGGFLMRLAFELAWVTVHLVYKEEPRFLSVDDLNFLRPVQVGSVVTLRSRIVYSEENTVHVTVDTRVHQPKSESQLTCVSHLTFAVPHTDMFLVVQPETYEEAMLFLEAKRRHTSHTQVVITDQATDSPDFGPLVGIPAQVAKSLSAL